jgi:two-component system chemotaxis response regulator CheB
MDHHSRKTVAPRMVGMVAATGAYQALPVILNGLPGEFPLPVLIVLSMPEIFVNDFVARLAERCRLPVAAAEDGQVPEPGKVYVAGTERHLIIEQGRLRFAECEPGVYNTMDVLFRSMARELGPGAVAVVLTGMGPDGAKGMKEIRDVGGYTIAQDEATSIVYHKARFAVGLNAVCESLPLEGIASRLLELASLGEDNDLIN